MRSRRLAGVISEEMGLDEILRKHVKVRGNKACNRTLFLLGIEGEITEIRFCYRDGWWERLQWNLGNGWQDVRKTRVQGHGRQDKGAFQG